MNHYEILGVGPDATEQQIKEAYRREAMKWHPDRHDGAAAKGEADRRFKDLAVAYRTLRNPVDRANYDRQLDQKLRQEYEARQQEQARQQRAHNEQAQQRQTRQEPPQPDFADTGPQFEEQTVSNDDANQMFYEQMLDLAFELAGRGFPEFNILKALVALGCPEPLAKSVAAVAIKRGGGVGKSKTTGLIDVTAISNVDDADWDVLEPYFTATIIGNAPQNPLSEDRYNTVLAKIASRTQLLLKVGIALCVVAFAVTHVKTHDLGLSFALTVGLGLLLFMLGILGRSSFLGPDQRMFLAEKTKRFFLNGFKILHAKDRGIALASDKSFRLASGTYVPEAFLFSIGWLGYRRIYTPAFLVAFALAGFYTVLTVYGVPDRTQNGFALPLGVLIATFANRMYFNNAKAKIRAAIVDAEPEQALAKLRNRGGTNVYGWISPFVVFLICLVPAIMIEEDRDVEKQRVAQEAKAAQVAADQAAVEVARQQAEQQATARAQTEYDRTIRSIEARFPQLNPDSPRHDPAAVSWVVERKKMYDQVGGRSTAATLQQAVDDFAAELQRQASTPSNVSATGTPPQDPYITAMRSRSARERHFQALADMGVKFPSLTGNLTFLNGDYRPRYVAEAHLLEVSQTWGMSKDLGSSNGFIVLQNRTSSPLSGVVLEVQAEPRGCENKGKFYYMSLGFAKSVPTGSVVGVRFTFPPEITGSNRCVDVVDAIF